LQRLVIRERPAYGGLVRIGDGSPGSEFGHVRLGIAESLRPSFEYSRFLETVAGDRVRSNCVPAVRQSRSHHFSAHVGGRSEACCRRQGRSR